MGLPLLLLVLGSSIALTVTSWLLNEKTKEEEEKQRELENHVKQFVKELNDTNKKIEQKRETLYREKSKEIADELIGEIRRLRRDREAIEGDLKNLRDSINQALDKPDITVYLKRGLKRELVLLEDAANRLMAYFRYCAWYEGKLKLFLRQGKYQEIFNFGPPNSLLPEDWLYIGKLLFLENEQELNNPNRYGQRITLSGTFISKDKICFEREKGAFHRYKSDIPILLVDEVNRVFDPKSKEKVEIDNPVNFRGSVLKGELYVNYLLKELPFLIKPKDEYLYKDTNYYYYKDAVVCAMKKTDKKYPLKKYPNDYEFFAYSIEHDLLLKKIVVSEKPQKEDTKSVSPIYLAYNSDEVIPKIHQALADSQYKLYVSKFQPDEGVLTFRAGEFFIDCSIKESYCAIENIREYSLATELSIELPFDFDIVPEKALVGNSTLLYDCQNSLTQMLSFIQGELDYIKTYSQDKVDDYDFIKKWLSIIEYQIAKEEITYYQVRYDEILKEGDDYYQNVLTIKIDHRPDNIKVLQQIYERIQNYYLGIAKKHGKDLKVALEIRLSPAEKFTLSPIGVLYDDIDVDRKIVKVQLDSNLPANIEFDPSKILYIGIFKNLTPLYRQQAALMTFNSGDMINPELKRMLISPYLIKKTVDSLQEKAFDRSIRWKNPDLTDNQKETIKKALLEENFYLIQGPPGTGKTTVIKEIVYQFLKDSPKRKCLIVSQQNTAVDNALLRIYIDNKENWFDNGSKSLVRISLDSGKVDENIQAFIIDRWFDDYKKRLVQRHQDTLTKDTRLQKLMKSWYSLVDRDNIFSIDREVVDVLLNNHSIVGATCVGFANKRIGIDRTKFDLVIIDEAARATVPELLIPILRAKKVILIGDQYQLPPSFGSSIVDDLEDLDNITLEFLQKSFFERLFEGTPEDNKSILTEQFRMPKEVGAMISKIFYGGILLNGIEKSTAGFISPKTIQWIDVKGENNKSQISRYNLKEAEAIRSILIDLYKKIPADTNKEIAIITPYAAQKGLLGNIVKDLKNHHNLKNLNIKCNTVDSFQGQEADIVIYSCVRTNGDLSFLIDRRRLNVALSRVKENLIIVGHKNFLYRAKTDGKENLFKTIIDYIDSLSWN